MNELTPNARAQIEVELGRPLVAGELDARSSIAQLSPAQLAVFRTLVRTQRIATRLYLRAVLPDALTPELEAFINARG